MWMSLDLRISPEECVFHFSGWYFPLLFLKNLLAYRLGKRWFRITACTDLGCWDAGEGSSVFWDANLLIGKGEPVYSSFDILLLPSFCPLQLLQPFDGFTMHTVCSWVWKQTVFELAGTSLSVEFAASARNRSRSFLLLRLHWQDGLSHISLV